jgi:hypothetical protein
MIDLTTQGALDMANDAIFSQASPHPTGTGVIDSFLRVQATGVEQGYNTDARPLQFNEKHSPNFTRSLPLSQVGEVTVGGVPYREFLLDINQQASHPRLSLDELRFYVANSPDLTGYNSDTNQLAGRNPVYDLGDNFIELNARLSTGSGGGDMVALIPSRVFDSAPDNQYVYLYCKFGVNSPANGGFEEWATASIAPPVNPNVASLSGFVYQDLNNNQQYDHALPDVPVPGVTIRLVDAISGTVVAQTMTDGNGLYNFTDVAPGVYNIQEGPAPFPLVHEAVSQPGTVNGLPDGLAAAGVVRNVMLGAGDVGINYNFGEVPLGGG